MKQKMHYLRDLWFYENDKKQQKVASNRAKNSH